MRRRSPGRDGGAAIDRSEGRSAVAVDIDAVSHGVRALQAQPDRTFEMRERIIAAHMERMDVGGYELVLALELLAQQLLDLARIHVEKRRQRADIDDVLEQLPLPRIRVFAIADLGKRHADDGDVV